MPYVVDTDPLCEVLDECTALIDRLPSAAHADAVSQWEHVAAGLIERVCERGGVTIYPSERLIEYRDWLAAEVGDAS